MKTNRLPRILRGAMMLALVPMLGAFVRSSAATPEAQPMNLVYTYHAFALDSAETMVEFDYQFNGGALVHVRDGEQRMGKLYLRLRLSDTTGRKVLETDWITSHPSATADVEPVTLMGQKLLAVCPGVYRADIYYEDRNNPSRRDSAQFVVNVPDHTTNRIGVSDIVIAADISQTANSTDPFYRNGYHLVPNVQSVIAPPFLVLNTYAEIYNANAIPSTEYSVIYALADSNGHVFYRKDLRRARPTEAAVTELNTLTLEEVPSGDYYLILGVYDGLLRSARDSSVVLRRFTLINPDKDSVLAAKRLAQQLPSDVVDPAFAGLHESELDEEFAKAKFIAQKGEKEMWEQLSGAASKARFLTEFWDKRNPTPGSATNSYKDDYYKRAAKAHTLYSSRMSPNGWDSDQGRVLLTYGTPDQIDRHPQDYNRRPYEAWHYNTQNLDFVFVDRSQTQTYILVNSTAPGEIHDDNWEEDYAQMHKFMNSQGWGD